MKPINFDDDFDEHGTLRDGRRLRVSLSMADSATGRSRQTLHDGRGNAAGHRPGFIVSDGSNNKSEHAYAMYDEEVSTAYLGSAREGAPCTCRGPEYPNDIGSPGHIELRNGRAVCVPDRKQTNEQNTDALTKDAAYREYDAQISEAWRQP